MTKHSNLLNTIQNYLNVHNFTIEEFCRLAHIDKSIIEKIKNKEHYVSLQDYQKLAFILNVDLTFVLTY